MIFDNSKRLFATVAYLSRRSKGLGKRKHDLLTGHGVENLTNIRLTLWCSMFFAIMALLNFVTTLSLSSLLVFSSMFVFMVWYIHHLPNDRITEELDERFGYKHKPTFKSYLGGRILLSPKGISLSMSKRTPTNITTRRRAIERKLAAAAIASATPSSATASAATRASYASTALKFKADSSAAVAATMNNAATNTSAVAATRNNAATNTSAVATTRNNEDTNTSAAHSISGNKKAPISIFGSTNNRGARPSLSSVSSTDGNASQETQPQGHDNPQQGTQDIAVLAKPQVNNDALRSTAHNKVQMQQAATNETMQQLSAQSHVPSIAHNKSASLAACSTEAVSAASSSQAMVSSEDQSCRLAVAAGAAQSCRLAIAAGAAQGSGQVEATASVAATAQGSGCAVALPVLSSTQRAARIVSAMLCDRPCSDIEDYVIAKALALSQERADSSCSALNSGYMTTIETPLLSGVRVYPGMPMTDACCCQLIAAIATHLSNGGHKQHALNSQTLQSAAYSLLNGADSTLSYFVSKLSSVANSKSEQANQAQRQDCALPRNAGYDIHDQGSFVGRMADALGYQRGTNAGATSGSAASTAGAAAASAAAASAADEAGAAAGGSRGHKIIKPNEVTFWGFGFVWRAEHTRLLHEKQEIGLRRAQYGSNGSPDIHAIGGQFNAYEPIYLPESNLKGHTLLLGTTGAGKTRFFDLEISQAIARGDTVIVIDPKGDRQLQRSIVRAAKDAGRDPRHDLFILDLSRKQFTPNADERTKSCYERTRGIIKPFGDESPFGSLDYNYPIYTRNPEQERLDEINQAYAGARDFDHEMMSNPCDSLITDDILQRSSSFGKEHSNDSRLKAASVGSEPRYNSYSEYGLAHDSCQSYDYGLAKAGFNDDVAKARAILRGNGSYSAHDDEMRDSYEASASLAKESRQRHNIANDSNLRIQIDCAINTAASRMLESECGYESSHDFVAPAAHPFAGSSGKWQGTALDEDDIIINCSNIGINPVAAFDQAAQIGARLTSMLSSSGASASFKNYSNMAVTAAVVCCQISGKRVTVENIRNFVTDPTALQVAIRTYINAKVDEIDNETVQRLWNAIHGVGGPLNRLSGVVSASLGPQASGEAPVGNYPQVIDGLIKEGKLKKSSFSTVLTQMKRTPTKPTKADFLTLFGNITDLDPDDDAAVIASMTKALFERAEEHKAAEDAYSASYDDSDYIDPTAATAAMVTTDAAAAAAAASCADPTDILVANCNAPDISVSRTLSPASGNAAAAASAPAGNDIADPAEATPAPKRRGRPRKNAAPAEDSACAEASKAKGTSTRKTAAKKAAKPKDLAASKKRVMCSQADNEVLQAFYDWLSKSGLCKDLVDCQIVFMVTTLPVEYYRKVTNSVVPYLGSLTGGALRGLLSGEKDGQRLPDLRALIEGNKIFLADIHCLKDADTGQTLGKMLLSDLAFVAGDINATGVKLPRISVFIDEASELADEALVQLLNKSRSAGFSITIATQSIADLSRRSGSKDAAHQIVANCNNLIAMRVNDPETASIVSSVLPHTTVGQRSSSVQYSNDPMSALASIGHGVMMSDSSLFPPDALMMLPDFEYVARFSDGSCYKGFIPRLAPDEEVYPDLAKHRTMIAPESVTTASYHASGAAKAPGDAKAPGLCTCGASDTSTSLNMTMGSEARANNATTSANTYGTTITGHTTCFSSDCSEQDGCASASGGVATTSNTAVTGGDPSAASLLSTRIYGTHESLAQGQDHQLWPDGVQMLEDGNCARETAVDIPECFKQEYSDDELCGFSEGIEDRTVELKDPGLISLHQSKHHLAELVRETNSASYAAYRNVQGYGLGCNHGRFMGIENPIKYFKERFSYAAFKNECDPLVRLAMLMALPLMTIKYCCGSAIILAIYLWRSFSTKILGNVGVELLAIVIIAIMLAHVMATDFLSEHYESLLNLWLYSQDKISNIYYCLRHFTLCSPALETDFIRGLELTIEIIGLYVYNPEVVFTLLLLGLMIGSRNKLVSAMHHTTPNGSGILSIFFSKLCRHPVIISVLIIIISSILLSCGFIFGTECVYTGSALFIMSIGYFIGCAITRHAK